MTRDNSKTVRLGMGIKELLKWKIAIGYEDASDQDFVTRCVRDYCIGKESFFESRGLRKQLKAANHEIEDLKHVCNHGVTVTDDVETKLLRLQESVLQACNHLKQPCNHPETGVQQLVTMVLHAETTLKQNVTRMKQLETQMASKGHRRHAHLDEKMTKLMSEKRVLINKIDGMENELLTKQKIVQKRTEELGELQGRYNALLSKPADPLGAIVLTLQGDLANAKILIDLVVKLLRDMVEHVDDDAFDEVLEASSLSEDQLVTLGLVDWNEDEADNE